MGCSALVGAALSLAGAGVNETAALKTQGKMNDIMSANQAQQNQLQQKNNGLFQNSLAASTPGAAQQQVQQGADKFNQAAQQAQAVPLGVANSALTAQDKGANSARAQLGNKAMSDFAGYGQYGVEQGLKDQQVGSQIGANNSQSQFINSLLPSELGAAQNSYAGLNSFGSLLGAAGNLTGAFGSLGALGGKGLQNGLGNAASTLGQSSLASPLYLGQAAPQFPKYLTNFGTGIY